jgi:tetratricopeptide (TPR) repeat protein
MGFLDRLAGRREERPPADLKQALITSYAAKDFERFSRLLNAQTAAIRRAFPHWLKMPEEICQDPVAAQKYAEMLFTIASLFEKSGDNSLIQRLSAGDPTEPWRRQMDAAQTHIDENRPNEAVALLRELLVSIGGPHGLSGPGVEGARIRALGRLGIALYHAGDRREAIAVTKQALELCRTIGDEEGIRAYTRNLEHVSAFNLPGGSAADRVVSVKNDRGEPVAFDEFAQLEGRFTWEVRGGGPIPPEAERLHQQGRDAGARGDYDAALSLLTQAAELAPSWGYPVYDRAFTHLLREDFTSALRDYRRTLELSPDGFFTADVAVDTLTRETEGELPPGLYAAFAALEYMPKEQRRDIAAQLIERFPSFAPGWAEHSNHVADAHQRLDAIERGLQARPDRQTRAKLLVLKALTLSSRGDDDAALAILHRLKSESTPGVGAAALAELVLARLSSKKSG